MMDRIIYYFNKYSYLKNRKSNFIIVLIFKKINKCIFCNYYQFFPFHILNLFSLLLIFFSIKVIFETIVDFTTLILMKSYFYLKFLIRLILLIILILKINYNN